MVLAGYCNIKQVAGQFCCGIAETRAYSKMPATSSTENGHVTTKKTAQVHGYQQIKSTTMGPEPDVVVDLRSDTVTLPSKGMREAIANAPLGDDVFLEDPTTNGNIKDFIVLLVYLSSLLLIGIISYFI